jgi:hypothetical protein
MFCVRGVDDDPPCNVISVEKENMLSLIKRKKFMVDFKTRIEMLKDLVQGAIRFIVTGNRGGCGLYCPANQMCAVQLMERIFI